jgi:hypothetical protein
VDKENLTCSPFAFHLTVTCFSLARHLLRRDVFGQMAPFLDAFAQVAGSWTMGISLACHLPVTCFSLARHLLLGAVFNRITLNLDAFTQVAELWTQRFSLAGHLLL